jgi:hypothetical protein
MFEELLGRIRLLFWYSGTHLSDILYTTKENSELIIAIFTIVLAVATVQLARATNVLARDTRDNSHRRDITNAMEAAGTLDLELGSVSRAIREGNLDSSIRDEEFNKSIASLNRCKYIASNVYHGIIDKAIFLSFARSSLYIRFKAVLPFVEALRSEYNSAHVFEELERLATEAEGRPG